jgi:pimeloyl-ACP methyl ester carboxylesterase
MSRTIVFVHGNFVTRKCWDPWVARYSARGYTCVAVAYPGREGPVEQLRRSPDAALLGSLSLERVVEHHVSAIRALGERPIVVGHSFGGLLTQLLVQRGLAAAAVAIDSVPPQGVLVPSWPFLRSTWPALNPFVPASRPYLMSFEHFQYTFVNDLAPAEQRRAYDAEVVPESRRLSRGGLSRAARIDFARPHAPLLLIAGEKDHIMPASLNRANHRRYARSPSVTEFREFAGRAHYSIIAGQGWETVADYVVDWATRHASAPAPAARATAPV